MEDILLLYDAEDAKQWMEYIFDLLSTNDLKLSVISKDLRSEQDDVLRMSSQFLVIAILVSPSMLETMASASEALAPKLQEHKCVSVIFLFTYESELTNELQSYQTLKNWKLFDITNMPDNENKKTVSKLVDLLEKERAHQIASSVIAAAKKHQKIRRTPERLTLDETVTQVETVSDDEPRQTDLEVKPKMAKRGTRQHRSLLEMVCPKKIFKSGETVVMISKQPLDGVVQVEFKGTDKKIDTKKLNPYSYRFIAPDMEFGRRQFFVFVDGKKQSISSLQYEAPTQMAYECPTFLCQALDITPGDMDSLDRKLTGIFRASLPNDEGLARILCPAVLATEAAASKVDHHFPTLLHFAAFHGLRDLCNALLDMPGATAAFCKKNKDDKDPLDLAEDGNHEDLVNFFMDYLEMQETIKTYELYVRMNKENTSAVGQPGYLEMRPGSDRVQEVDYSKEEDDYEIKKSVLESGVVEVRADEDIVEEPKPGLPPRKPVSKAKPTPPVLLEEPPVTPRRNSLPQEPPEPPLESPEEFFGMVGPKTTLYAGSTGSGTLDELIQIQEAFKRREINDRDVQMLYTAWNVRNKEGYSSASMKERQKQLNEMKENYRTLIKTAEKKEKQGFFKRLTTKKKKQPAMEIEHIPSSNPYTTWTDVPYGFVQTRGQPMTERDARVSTISNSSTSSSSSYGSTLSRDSALSLQIIQESESDEELEEAPPVPVRQKTTYKSNTENRQSLSEQFLQCVQNKPHSRLPQPPTEYHRQKPQTRTPVHKSATLPYSSAPVIPPRKISK